MNELYFVTKSLYEADDGDGCENDYHGINNNQL